MSAQSSKVETAGHQVDKPITTDDEANVSSWWPNGSRQRFFLAKLPGGTSIERALKLPQNKSVGKSKFSVRMVKSLRDNSASVFRRTIMRFPTFTTIKHDIVHADLAQNCAFNPS